MTQTNSLLGKVTLVTGANTGIGRVTALELARRGAHVFLGSRDEERGQQAVAAIRSATGSQSVEFWKLDLGDLEQVRQSALAFLARDLPLSLLINNAGVAGQRGITRDGFELHFGTNHLGHFLLTQLLLERLRASAPARIVTVASIAHFQATGIDFAQLRRKTRSITGLPEYSVSKLANVLFSAELGRKLSGTGVTTYALHPGVVASDAWRRIPWPFRKWVTRSMLSVEDGARTSLYCATSPEVAGETGYYYDACKRAEPSQPGQDLQLARELWERSVAWLTPLLSPARAA